MDRLNIGSEKKKKKLLVLPLRGIIVYRAHRSRPETVPRNRRPDFSYGSFLGYRCSHKPCPKQQCHLKSGRSSPITGVPVMTSTIKRYPDSGITNAVFSSGDNEEQKDKKEALFYTLISKNKLPGPNKSTTMATETKVLKIKSTLVVSDEKEAGIKNVVADSGDSSGSEEQKNETDTVTGLTISMDRVNIGSQKKKKKLLVIPLRGIFVHRAHRWWPATIPRNRQPDFCYGNFLVYMRPYCVGFLKFCFERFNVGLWSSTREQNLQGILDYVMGDLKNKLLFTWDQEHCTDSGFMCLENQDKPLFLKELSHIWEKKYPNLPWSDGEYSASNTLLITYPEKALLNPPNTAIFPQGYDPESKKDDLLGPDGELRVFLAGLAEAEDVQTYVEDHPICDPEITPSHPNWDHYCKIICCINKKRFGDPTPKLI